MRGISIPTGENVGMQLQGRTDALPDGLDCVNSDLLEDLRDGVIDKLPESALECLPSNVRDDIPPELIDFATANPQIAVLAVVVAVLATLVCLYKLAKRAFLVALVTGAVAIAAWWWRLTEPNVF